MDLNDEMDHLGSLRRAEQRLQAPPSRRPNEFDRLCSDGFCILIDEYFHAPGQRPEVARTATPPNLAEIW